MPNPFKRLHEGVGLWSRTEMPTDIEYQVLKHLVEAGKPRLYTHKYSSTVSVSNSDRTTGWSTRASMFHLFSGCHHNRLPWVTLDKLATRKCLPAIRVYKINAAGYEAIAQYEARNRYDKETLDLARRILTEQRRIMSARNDN